MGMFYDFDVFRLCCMLNVCVFLAEEGPYKPEQPSDEADKEDEKGKYIFAPYLIDTLNIQ